MATLSDSIKKLKELNLDLLDVQVVTEPRGFHGWYVHLCFTNGKCCDFSIDATTGVDMLKMTLGAIHKQLEYHRKQNTQSTARLSTVRDSVQVVLGRTARRELEITAIRNFPDGSFKTYQINLGKETPKPLKGLE